MKRSAEYPIQFCREIATKQIEWFASRLINFDDVCLFPHPLSKFTTAPPRPCEAHNAFDASKLTLGDALKRKKAGFEPVQNGASGEPIMDHI